VNRTRRTCLGALTILGAAFLSPAASATTIPPPGGDTVAYPYSVTKSGSTITAKFKFDSGQLWNWIRVSGVVDRTGGGATHITKYGSHECGRTTTTGISACYLTMTITDVAGTQNYWITMETSNSGTAAGRSTKEVHCLGLGITCSGVNVSY
jgi:hypothetical protein